ncbi:MAG: hypothetical protein KKE20_04145 [Nanoarchaeota archaeon]|nr:hypothetical protein [Nanoarchaeota archaeon]
MKSRLGKKGGGWMPPVKESIVIIVAVIIISIFFSFMIFGGSAADKSDIDEKGKDIKQYEILMNLLRSPIRVSKPLIINEGFGKETDFAELITIHDIEENDDLKDEYEDVLEAKAEYVLNPVYGSGNWEVKIINAKKQEYSIGNAGGTTRSIETKIPSYSRELLTVALIIEE